MAEICEDTWTHCPKCREERLKMKVECGIDDRKFYVNFTASCYSCGWNYEHNHDAFVFPRKEESPKPPYGRCPYCGSPSVSRERRPNGNDRCEDGHVYPSREAVR